MESLAYKAGLSNEVGLTVEVDPTREGSLRCEACFFTEERLSVRLVMHASRDYKSPILGVKDSSSCWCLQHLGHSTCLSLYTTRPAPPRSLPAEGLVPAWNGASSANVASHARPELARSVHVETEALIVRALLLPTLS